VGAQFLDRVVRLFPDSSGSKHKISTQLWARVPQLIDGRPSTLPRLPGAAPTFDLQSHSRHSDGALGPGEIVTAAAAAGVELLALSDHDSIDGVQEAFNAAAELGIGLVSAVEISAVDGDKSDLHILGYLIDHQDAILAQQLESFRADREHRAEAMAGALTELGFELDQSILQRRIEQGKSVGRPHLAQAVVGHPANAERLAADGLTDPTAFLVAYLIEGRPAFRTRTRPTVAEAIGVIHEAGGVAVWAHPFWDIPDPQDVLRAIDRYRSVGLDGVECFYVTHDRDQTGLLFDRCAELALLTTGSSDFHGPDHRQFSSFRAFSTFGHEPVLGPIAA
jgi:3',5'-nucleoside bisphosphate phosphatase